MLRKKEEMRLAWRREGLLSKEVERRTAWPVAAVLLATVPKAVRSEAAVRCIASEAVEAVAHRLVAVEVVDSEVQELVVAQAARVTVAKLWLEAAAQ